MRQVDAGAHDPAPARADRGRDRVRGRRHGRPRAARDEGLAPAHADRLPGLGRLARPAHEGRRPDRGGPRDPRERRPQGAEGDRARHAPARRHAAGGGRPLPAPVQRRPAAADRARPRARPAAEARRRRRARVGARRLDPVAGAEPARGAEEGVRPHLRLRRTRPRRRRLHLRPRRRDVSRPDRRDRAVRRALRQAAAPVHRGPALGQPGAGAGPEEHPHRPHRRRAEPDRSALRLPLPDALPDRAGDLRRGRPDAARTTATTTAPRATSPGRRFPAQASSLHDRAQ